MIKKPILAVDIDDVIVESVPNIIDFYNKEYGTNATVGDFYAWNSANWQDKTPLEIVTRINRYLESDQFLNAEPTQEAITVIRQLNGKYDLAIVSGRPNIIEKATLSWLKRHFPDIFREVVLTQYFKLGDSGIKSKAEVCKEIGASILIDDHLEHIRIVAAAGIRSLLFGDYPWNQADKLPPNVKRVKDWQAVARELL